LIYYRKWQDWSTFRVNFGKEGSSPCFPEMPLSSPGRGQHYTPAKILGFRKKKYWWIYHLIMYTYSLCWCANTKVYCSVFGGVWNGEHLNRQIDLPVWQYFRLKAWIYILNRNNAYILKGLNEAQNLLRDYRVILVIKNLVCHRSQQGHKKKQESATKVSKRCFTNNCTKCKLEVSTKTKILRETWQGYTEYLLILRD
jgi:hypothetical protein